MHRVEFNNIAPLITHLLESAKKIDIFLNEMTANAEVSIPTLPMRHCKAVIITLRTLAEVEALFPLVSRGYFNIHTLSAKGKQYSLKFSFTKRIATIDTDNQRILDDFAAFVGMIPGAELRVIN